MEAYVKYLILCVNHELYHDLNVFHLFRFLNTQMFSAGLKLMVVGMLMVLLFLLLMMLFIMLIEFLNRSHTKNGSPEDSTGKEGPETERFSRTYDSCSGFGSSSIRIRG